MLTASLKRPQLHHGRASGCARLAVRSSSWVCSRVQTTTFSRALTAAKAVKDEEKEGTFYNRLNEIKMLTTKLASDPKGITVVTGPSDTGKSAIMNQIVEVARLYPNASGRKQVFLTLDCRDGSTTNPAALALQLTQQNDSADLKLNGLDFEGLEKWIKQIQLDKFVVQLQDARNAAPLDEVISRLRRWLNEYPGKPWPVIFIDEANRLRDWEDDTALKTLLDFFVKISKQTPKCHVVLATSDSFLTNWLETKGIRRKQYSVVTIGDLTQDEVKGYVYGAGKWSGMVNKTFLGEGARFTLPETMWGPAYMTLGGNVGAWRSAVLDAAGNFKIQVEREGKPQDEDEKKTLQQAWDDVLEAARAAAAVDMDQAFQPETVPDDRQEPARWTAQQWVAVLKAIRSAPHHAVPYRSLCRDVDSAAVKSLLSHNFIALRHPSRLARDLPAEVCSGRDKVVTAPDAAVLEWILSDSWQSWEDSQVWPKAGSGASSSSSSRPSSPTSTLLQEIAEAIEKVTLDIEDMKGNIHKVDETIEKVCSEKSQSWLEELAYVQQRRQGLVKVDEQLRGDRQQLREKELVLMKREDRGQ